ncbi:NAD(P)H-dependent oxidoreductase [Ruminococcaceae bacterium OttesenSCG-928-O06]|nr:NAD(P)H-dependent oxidoreductase [Ruminococcaceae bacterium OttesenSCG-928-O06]
MGKKLVAYFSASGVTARLAKTLAEAVGAELYEIQPEAPYTKADLDWNDKQSRSTVEMQDAAFRPALANKNADIAACDTIFVGFPIWWYVAPTIVNTFLESYDFAGKPVVPFATSGSSGMGDTLEKLRPSAPSAVWKEGRRLKASTPKEELAAWVQSLGL